MVSRIGLLRKLEAVAPGLSSREIVEQATCVAFHGGRMWTFNDEVACSVPLPGLDAEGAVPAAPLAAMLKKLDEDEVDLIASDGELLIKGNRRCAGVRMEAEIRMPVADVECPGEWVSLGSSLVSAIRRAASCVSRCRSQFVLTCVRVAPGLVEGCDSFQLVRSDVDAGAFGPFLVRGEAVAAVLDSAAQTEWSLSDGWVHFRGDGGTETAVRRYVQEYLSLDEYVDVKGTGLRFPPGLAAAADKAAVFSKELVEVSVCVGELKLKAIGPDGWYGQSFDCGWEGDGFSFSLSPRLLIEITGLSEEVVVAPGRLAVVSDGWRYVTCTRDPGDG